MVSWETYLCLLQRAGTQQMSAEGKEEEKKGRREGVFIEKQRPKEIQTKTKKGRQ